MEIIVVFIHIFGQFLAEMSLGLAVSAEILNCHTERTDSAEILKSLAESAENADIPSISEGFRSRREEVFAKGDEKVVEELLLVGGIVGIVAEDFAPEGDELGDF